MTAATDYEKRALNLLNPHLDFRLDFDRGDKERLRNRVTKASKPLQEAYSVLKDLRRGCYALSTPPPPPKNLVSRGFRPPPWTTSAA